MTLQARQTAAIRRRMAGDRGVDATYRRRVGGADTSVSLRAGIAEALVDTRPEEGLQTLDGSRAFRVVAADLLLAGSAVRPRVDGADTVIVDAEAGLALAGEYRVVDYETDAAGASYFLNCVRVEG